MSDIVFKPFISLDIETTGLKENNPYVLEIGAIFHDFGFFNKKLELDIIIDNGELDPKRCSDTAMKMNERIFDAIKNKQDNVVSLKRAQEMLSEFLKECTDLMKSDETYFRGAIQIAGKNASGFDVPILEDNGFKLNGTCHRFIDVGSMYFNNFGYVPSLNQICKHLNLEKVDHVGINDARKVIQAIEKKLCLY